MSLICGLVAAGDHAIEGVGPATARVRDCTIPWEVARRGTSGTHVIVNVWCCTMSEGEGVGSHI